MKSGFEGKSPFHDTGLDSLKIDEERIKQSAEQAAHTLIAQQATLSDEQVSVWKVADDSTQIRQRLLSWEAGEDPEYAEAPLAQRIAYAKEYLKRLKNGIA